MSLRTIGIAAAPALAAVALAALSSSGSSSAQPERGEASPIARASGTQPAGAARASPAPGPHAPALYRVSGCVSRGAGPYRHGPSRREVAIGFDDGPAPITAAFVAMLERTRTRATFFLIGRQVYSGYRGLLLRELRDGDALGDHSFTHPDLVRSGGVRTQLSYTISAIRSLTGYAPCVFRPPYGSYDSSTVRLAASLGLATVLWNVDPTDWARPGASAIVQRVLAQVQPGSIVISHDGGGFRDQTLAAYPKIIAGLRARGYAIVTIPELLGFRPVYTPCMRLCYGIGVRRREVPRGALVQGAS